MICKNFLTQKNTNLRVAAPTSLTLCCFYRVGVISSTLCLTTPCVKDFKYIRPVCGPYRAAGPILLILCRINPRARAFIKNNFKIKIL